VTTQGKQSSEVLMVAPEVHRRDEGVAASRTLTEVAVGIVQRSDGLYLLTTRPQGKAYAGYWEFPGGKLEAQESVVAALRRELQEEINITIADAEMVRTDVVDYPHALVRLHFCLITQWSGEIQMREQQTFAWSDLPTALSPILPGTVPVLAWLATVGKLPKS
jgi:8-oxo-dGTP diphosphatase|tara:strand:+ start:54 stop:542 length:489 start_codon:yes stop_codon:yes gene_type:complete